MGTDGIFFASSHGRHDLPEGAVCDALVMPSVNDSYPQTPLEAMAVGLPVLATRGGGFPRSIDLDADKPTGWLVPPDGGEDTLTDAIVEAVEAAEELARRGAAALVHARHDL